MKKISAFLMVMIMIKKMLIFLSAVMLVFMLTACGSRETTEKQSAQLEQTESQTADTHSIPERTDDEGGGGGNKAPTEAESDKVLVAYFSWAENALQENIDAMTSASVKAPGNVAQFASWIAEETGGELFSIQVTEPYPADWDGCLKRANEEKSDNARPELVRTVEDIENYDVIFLGYPNWWYSCPMAIFSFIESHDLSGKKIYLFCSHGTGGLARSVQDIMAALPDSSISEDAFDAYEEDTMESQESLIEWLNGLKK